MKFFRSLPKLCLYAEQYFGDTALLKSYDEEMANFDVLVDKMRCRSLRIRSDLSDIVDRSLHYFETLSKLYCLKDLIRLFVYIFSP